MKLNILLIICILTLNLLKFICANNITSEKKVDYSTNLIRNEYILLYNGFYTKNMREQIINNITDSLNISKFDIVKKKPIFETLLSDFDLIKVYSRNDQVSLLNLQHYYVKNVFQQRKVFRKLTDKTNNYELSEIDSKNNNPLKLKNRQLFRAIPRQLVDQIDVKILWNEGITGQGINVAIFDTGLEENHPHFNNVIERIDWTDENDANDKLGHGTFVCGLVASSKECLGLAPDVNLYIFKVFTDSQVSYTSWFLDAFNYVIQKKIHVLNLSIGGPDFMDIPFVNKVWEITSNNIIMVSGIGNDGPLYGTLNNPADQLDVIGVGGINSEDQIAKFSSRGMTTWELPEGYGRVKPDIVSYCTHVRGSRRSGGCRTLSGTSVASPIITGAISLLLSSFNIFKFNYEPNPAIVKQIIMAGADRIENANVFEQGHGKLNLIEAFKVMKKYQPQASLIPSYIDLTESPYFWPYSSQPIYYSGLPIMVNVTILNGLDVTGYIKRRPKWKPSIETDGNFLKMSFSYPKKLWPWSGYLAIEVSVKESAKYHSGFVEGLIQLEIESAKTANKRFTHSYVSHLDLYFKAEIIPTPTRKQRILWDQFHNLRYPSGYFPRDDLKVKSDPLDWNADHPHTNFKDMYQYLRNSGYFVEILGQNYNCFDPSNYGVLLVVDPEEEFHKSEIRKIYTDITSKGMSLIVFADWFNASVIKNAKFYDENTRKWWTPLTGGSNIPALNDLLEPFEISFGDKVYDGEFKIGEHATAYASGTSITKFPKSDESYLFHTKLKNQGEEFLLDYLNKTNFIVNEEIVPILGLYQNSEKVNSGRVAVYGDSNCLDTAHKKSDCFWLLSALLEFTLHNNVFRHFKKTNTRNFHSSKKNVERVNFEKFSQHSKIYDKNLRSTIKQCRKTDYEKEYPIEKIPLELYPSKENYYNFLRLNDEIKLEKNPYAPEIRVINIPNDLDEFKQVEEEHEYPTNKLVFHPNFPHLASIAVLLVFFYILKRLWKYKRSVQIRIFNSFRRLNRRE